MSERRTAIEQARRHLLRTSAPRLQMTLVVVLTAGVGFLASVLLLRAGVWRMAVRYPLAILIAYGAFILLLRAWLGWQRHRGRLLEHLDLPNLSVDFPTGISRSGGPDFEFGGGGGFGGGGAGGGWEAAAVDPRPLAVSASPPTPSAPAAEGGGFDLDLDLDDGLVIVPIAAAVAAALASLYVIYAAPALFAELLVDGLVVSALYRRMRHVERRHWLRCVVRKTWLPALLTALAFAVAGHVMQKTVPGARSIGPFLDAVSRR